MPRATFVSDRTTRRQEKRDRVFQQHQSEGAKRNGPPRRRRSAPSVRPPPPPPTPLPPSPPPSPPPPPTSAGGGDDQELSVLCDDEDEPPPPRPRFNTAQGKSVIRITTGSHGLDQLFSGGFAINEAFGGLRSGKAQLAHTCVSTQLPTHMHGGNGKVAYLDTEGTFLPERLVPIAERFGLDPGSIFDNILDSLIALFRVDFTGRGELADCQQKLAQMLSGLIKIAEEFNVAVYMTNQVIDDPGGGVFISDPKKPAGGHVLAHVATIRLVFRKGKGEQRVCKMFDAPLCDFSECLH